MRKTKIASRRHGQAFRKASQAPFARQLQQRQQLPPQQPQQIPAVSPRLAQIFNLAEGVEDDDDASWWPSSSAGSTAGFLNPEGEDEDDDAAF